MNFISIILSIIIGVLLIFNTKKACALLVGRVGDKEYQPSKRFISLIKLVGILFTFLGVTNLLLLAFAS